MNPPRITLLGTLIALTLGTSPLAAQVLHTNDRWHECSFLIDPALTQSAWHQFVREFGLVTYFRPLASARPLGPRHVEFAVLNWATRINAADDAWNHTFSHPDSTHWLFDGDALPIPGLMLRVGVTERMDVGAYFTKSVGANYGFVGGQLQYNLLNDSPRKFAAAARASVVALFGPEDLSASAYGLDFVVSRDISIFSPYAGVSGYLSHGHEKTSRVDLADETVFGMQGTVGVAARVWVLSLGTEFNLARVPGYSFKIGLGS